MRFCQPHWDALREAIRIRALSHLVARSGREATQRMVEEVEGVATDATYDPLMAAHWLIADHAIEELGLYLMRGDYCPVCEVVAASGRCRCARCSELTPEKRATRLAEVERNYIDGPADAVLRYCRTRKLVPSPSPS